MGGASVALKAVGALGSTMARMGGRVRAAALGACVFVLSIALPAAGRTETLPVSAQHYADLCRQSGGAASAHLNSGLGTTECAWSGHGSTECKVGAAQVNVCAIACESNACVKANPDRYNPRWPLNGGPKSAPLQTSPGADTLAPAN